MKDAKGHGSDPRGGAAKPVMPGAHQHGIMSYIPHVDPAKAAKIATAAYVAQAAAGAAVGFTYPILKALGVF